MNFTCKILFVVFTITMNDAFDAYELLAALAIMNNTTLVGNISEYLSLSSKRTGFLGFVSSATLMLQPLELSLGFFSQLKLL